MGDGELNRGATWRLIGAALLLAVSCATGALLTLSADAGARGPATGAVPAAGAPSVPRAAVGQSASGPVQDDPVIAPDPHESADNNVSFPADI